MANNEQLPERHTHCINSRFSAGRWLGESASAVAQGQKRQSEDFVGKGEIFRKIK